MRVLREKLWEFNLRVQDLRGLKYDYQLFILGNYPECVSYIHRHFLGDDEELLDLQGKECKQFHRVPKDNKCLECKEKVWEEYMLNDELWKQVNPKVKGEIHLNCVEKRLGRQLIRTDFKDVPLNIPIFHIFDGKYKN